MARTDLRGSSQLVDYVLSLRVDRIRQLFAANELTIGGRTKAELRSRVEEALAADELTQDEIVAYLDKTEPWGRQHAFVYRADRATSTAWRDTDAITAQLPAAAKALVGES